MGRGLSRMQRDILADVFARTIARNRKWACWSLKGLSRCEAASRSRALRRLEARGLVIRWAGSPGRWDRAFVVALTAAGEDVAPAPRR